MIVRLIGKQEVDDPAVIAAAEANCACPPEARANLKSGGVACLRKYGVNVAYVAESQLAMGLLIWAGVVGSQVKTLKDAGKLLRGENAVPSPGK